MIHKFSIRSTIPEPDVERRRRALGLPDLELWLDYYIEFEAPVSAENSALLCQMLGNLFGTVAIMDEPFPPDAVEALHRRGVVDNESPSIVFMCELLGLPARGGKMARCYASSFPRLREIIESIAFNSAIEEIHSAQPHLATLVPAGTYLPAEHFDMSELREDDLAELGRANGRNLVCCALDPSDKWLMSYHDAAKSIKIVVWREQGDPKPN